ncbi:TetR/AcrR family transcriptional regulator [Peribacillus frigoritolerans]|uniref:TetR/AcrR family transcriptional regulator n=1 Tax=Peribacillus frigoritolerans TaxID=450367 RepID=UPI0039A3344D
MSVETIMYVAAKIFASKGYRSTRLDDIARKLNVSKPALYYYIDSKYQILVLIFEKIMDIYITNANEIIKMNLAPEDKFKGLVRKHAMALVENQELSKIFFHERAQLTLTEQKELYRKVRVYEAIFEQAYLVGQGTSFKNLNVQIVIKGIFGMINSLYYYEGQKTASSPEIVNVYIEILEEGFKI